jgi:hypothetical protein
MSAINGEFFKYFVLLQNERESSFTPDPQTNWILKKKNLTLLNLSLSKLSKRSEFTVDQIFYTIFPEVMAQFLAHNT